LPGDAQAGGEAGRVPAAAEQWDEQEGVHGPQGRHPVGGEVRAQPGRVQSRKQLDKSRQGADAAIGRFLAHTLILPHLTLTSPLPKLRVWGFFGAAGGKPQGSP
jgi:hypothetical protein